MVQIHPWEGQFWGENATHCKVQGRSVVSCANTTELIEMSFGFRSRVGPRNHVLNRGSDRPMWRCNFERKGHALACSITLCRELCKNGWTSRDAIWVVDPGGLRKHVLGGVHTSATWRIPLNHPCAAAMRPFCQITLTTCSTSRLIHHITAVTHTQWVCSELTGCCWTIHR